MFRTRGIFVVDLVVEGLGRIDCGSAAEGVTTALRAVKICDCSATLCRCFNLAIADFLEELDGVGGGSGISSASFAASEACFLDGMTT